MSTKLHAGCLDETSGVSLLLTGGARHDAPGFETVWEQRPETPELDYGVMDRAYDSDPIRRRLQDDGVTPVIPPRSKCQEPIDYDEDQYKLRQKVERFFNKLKQFRRIATRYEKLAQTFLALIHLVSAWIMVK